MNKLLQRIWDFLLLGWNRYTYCELLKNAITIGDEETRKFALQKLDELDENE